MKTQQSYGRIYAVNRKKYRLPLSEVNEVEAVFNFIKSAFAALMSLFVMIQGLFGIQGKKPADTGIPEIAPGIITADDISEAGAAQPVIAEDTETPSVNYADPNTAFASDFELNFDSSTRSLPSKYTANENKVYKAVSSSYETADAIHSRLTGISLVGVRNALNKLVSDGYIQTKTVSNAANYKRLAENLFINGAVKSGDYYYVCGEGSSISGSYQGSIYSCSFISKHSQDGTLVKSVEISNASNEIHYTDITSSGDGGTAVCGYKYTGTGALSYAFIEKYDADINLVWSKKLYGDGSDYLNCIALCSDGGFVAGGNTTSTTHDFDGIPDYGFSCAVLMKFNSDGERVWCRYLGGSGIADVTDVDTDSLGNIFADISAVPNDGEFAGFSGKIKNSLDNVIIRYDNNGLMKWKCVLSTNSRDYFDRVCADGSGGCLAGGNFTYTAGGLTVASGTLSGLVVSGKSDIVVVSIGSYGTITKSRLLKGTGGDFLRDIKKVRNGWLLVGYSDSYDGEFGADLGDYDAFAEVIDTKLAKAGMTIIGGSERDTATAAVSDGGSFTVFGDIDSTESGAVTSSYFVNRYTLSN